MVTLFERNEQRKIRIEPNPFKPVKQKFKMRVRKIKNGVPVVALNGNPVYVDETPESLYRVPGTHTRLCVARTNNGVKTGLNVLVKNPYKDTEVFRVEWADRILRGKEKVLLQHLLEYEFDFAFDYLTHRIPEGAVASDEPNKKFFQLPESKPMLDGNVKFLNMNNPVHRINYYTLLASRDVASSWEDLEDGGNTDASWYIVDEESKQLREKSKAMRTVEGGSAIKELNDSNSDAIIKMAKALELSEASDKNITKNKAFNAIFSYYNKGGKEFDNFMDWYSIWKDPGTRNRFVAASEVYDYIRIGVVSYKNGRYTWYKAVPGQATENFTFNGKNNFINEFLLDPAMQEHVELLQEEYENKIR